MALHRWTRVKGVAPLVAIVLPLACQPPGDSGSLGTFQVTEILATNSCGAQAIPFQSAVVFNAQIRVAQGVMHWTPESASDTVGTYDTASGSFRLEADETIPVSAVDVRHQIASCTLDRADVIQGILTITVTDGGTATSVDAGTDSSVVDAGTDAGTDTDAGTTGDAGIDGGTGTTDAGAGAGDAGTWDAGTGDAGTVSQDAGVPAGPRMTFTGTQTIVYGSDPTGDCSPIVGAASGDFTALPCTVTYTIQGVSR